MWVAFLKIMLLASGPHMHIYTCTYLPTHKHAQAYTHILISVFLFTYDDQTPVPHSCLCTTPNKYVLVFPYMCCFSGPSPPSSTPLLSWAACPSFPGLESLRVSLRRACGHESPQLSPALLSYPLAFLGSSGVPICPTAGRSAFCPGSL